MSFGHTVSYLPFRESLSAAFDIGEPEFEGEAWKLLTDGLTRLFGDEAEELLPFIATLLSLPMPDSHAQRIEALRGLSVGHQIYRSTYRLMTRLAQERPTVLALEDWHWADASSAEQRTSPKGIRSQTWHRRNSREH